jgi:hypothetical protein
MIQSIKIYERLRIKLSIFFTHNCAPICTIKSRDQNHTINQNIRGVKNKIKHFIIISLFLIWG